MIYFDHNATSAMDPRVLESMLPFLTTHHGNASSLHQYGRFASTAVEQAREQVAVLCGAHPSEIIFTSGATEANNQIVKGLSYQTDDHLIYSAIEHRALLGPVAELRARGITVSSLPVDGNGVVIADNLENKITAKTRLIAVMLANNETGVIQPLDKIVAAAKTQKNCLIFTDAVQAFGKIRVSFAELGVDFMSISAHKFGGPKGIGALVLQKQHALMPLLSGGEQEEGLRSGTLNVAGIVGFGRAAEIAYQEITKRHFHLLSLQHHLEELLETLPEIKILGEKAKRLPNTTYFAVDGFDGEALIMALDKAGIAVSSGSACGRGEPSHVVSAMGFSNDLAHSVIRVSFGINNTTAEIDQFSQTLQDIMYERTTNLS